MMSKEELQEIKCLRAVLERILRVMDEGLFVDYQMEKFGQINYNKELLIKAKHRAHSLSEKSRKPTFRLSSPNSVVVTR